MAEIEDQKRAGIKGNLAAGEQVLRVKKLVGLPPTHSNYLDVFLRLRRASLKLLRSAEL